jgi:hypothetical protein
LGARVARNYVRRRRRRRQRRHGLAYS